ncbi:F-box protein [Striga asiatica]|uniref:F-box protein n=1 Tax=Striga asiatica TaxID=4170 RepID=A0A5A7R7R2_STRAF|nr:F-box protein [Striga asiatica]
MASLNLNPNPLLKPSSFPVGRKKNPLFKSSSFPIGWKKNKSKLNLHKTFSITYENCLHTSSFQSKARSKFIIGQFPLSNIRNMNYVVVSIDKENLEPKILNRMNKIDTHRNFLPYAASNGLILLLCDNICGEHLDIPQEALWNPTTNELKILPPSPATLDPRYVKIIRNHFGFAYDSTSNDYKVIRFLGRYDDLSYSLGAAELYSLKTNSWKGVDFHPSTFHPCGNRFMKINANGTYYWLNNVDHNFIQSFTFATEKFDSYRVPMPPSNMFNGYKFCQKRLVEYRGSLGFLASTSMYVDKVNYCAFELWVWDAASLSWCLESEFLVNKMRSFMGLFENDKLFYLQSGGDLMVQDCATNKAMNLSNAITHEVGRLYPFVENYVSLSLYGK